MKYVGKQFFVIALSLLATNALECYKPSAFIGLKERLKTSKEDWQKVQEGAARYKASILSKSNAELEAYANVAVDYGTVQVGVDNTGQSITLAYLEAGNKVLNIGTIVCVEPYFGREGFKLQAQAWALQGYYIVAFDMLGQGSSSQNDPVALDGIGGYAGYSFQQDAYFIRQALAALGINNNTPDTPITLIGTDIGGMMALFYAVQYEGDVYGLTNLIVEDTNFAALVSDNPCSLGLLSIEEAQQVADYYALGEQERCQIICALLSGEVNQPGHPGEFTEINCPDYGNYLQNQAVQYSVLTTPTVFQRRFVDTFQIDPLPILQNVNVPVLILNGGIYQLLVNKQIAYCGLYGLCYGCQPDCTDTTYYLPCPNSICICYQDASLVVHLTRWKKFNRDVVEFISGVGGICEPVGDVDVVGLPCAACPTK